MFSNSQTARVDARNASSLAGELVDTSDAPSLGRRRMLVMPPAGVFAALSVVLGWGLSRNAQIIPSALIGKEVPAFSLPPVQGRTLGLSSIDLNLNSGQASCCSTSQAVAETVVSATASTLADGPAEPTAIALSPQASETSVEDASQVRPEDAGRSGETINHEKEKFQ